MIVSRYFCLFIIYSMFGWVYETIYCTIKGRKWENRGFLYGPVCPIYGVGAVLISLLAKLFYAFDAAPAMWQIFLISFLGSIILEYSTSFLLERAFHAVWWDYSNQPLNIHGRVCFFVSLGFGIAGIVVVRYIVPAMERIISYVPDLLTEIFSLLFMAVFAIDMTLTISALTNFARIVSSASAALNENMDERIDQIVQNTTERLHSISDTYKLALQRVVDFRYPNSLRSLFDSIVPKDKRRNPRHLQGEHHQSHRSKKL